MLDTSKGAHGGAAAGRDGSRDLPRDGVSDVSRAVELGPAPASSAATSITALLRELPDGGRDFGVSGLIARATRQISGELTAAEAEEAARERDPGPMPPRPRTRGDCVDGPRPCPWAGCRYHLYVDTTRQRGVLRLNFPAVGAADLAVTCALDVADEGPHTLEDVGRACHLTRERVRQIQDAALARLQSSRSDAGEPPDGRRPPGERGWRPRGPGFAGAPQDVLWALAQGHYTTDEISEWTLRSASAVRYTLSCLERDGDVVRHRREGRKVVYRALTTPAKTGRAPTMEAWR